MYKVLTPAYGRDYKSKKAVEADFNANKDFYAQPEHRATNKSDLIAMNIHTVNIRYKKLTMVTVINF